MNMKDKIQVHLALGRLFAAPAAIAGVLLGCALVHEWSWLTAMVALCALFLMGWAHSMNTLLDYSWTGFDKGTAEERSKGKVYTKAQQPIAAGVLSEKAVLGNAIVWLALSVAFAGIISWQVGPWVWLPFGLIVPMTFLYSWGKLHYLCELALGLGFGSFAVMLGVTVSPNPKLGTAFLAGIPFVLMWGWVAETYDQWTDASPNWPRGLRNLGALVWKYELSIAHFLGWLIAMTYLSQLFLIAGNILAPLTGLSMLALPLFAVALPLAEKKSKTGILILLAGIFLHMALLVIGQAIG